MKTAPVSNDIFSFRSSDGTRANPRELAEVAIALAESCDTTTQGISFETDPVAFQVTMTESLTAGFQGYTGVDSQGQPKISPTRIYRSPSKRFKCQIGVISVYGA